MPKAVDLTGRKFNQLTAIEWAGHAKANGGAQKRTWLFRCDCGRQKVLRAEHVTRGHIKSCGCLKRSREPNQGPMATAYQVFKSGTKGNYADGDLTFEDFLELSRQDCFWCGCPPSTTRQNRNKKPGSAFTYNGLDRINHNLPHDRLNVLPACWTCNERRSNTPIGEWMNWIQAIYQTRFGKLDAI